MCYYFSGTCAYFILRGIFIMLKIANIIAKTVPSAFVKYDEDFGVEFDLLFIQKEELNKITGQFTKMKFNPKTHQKDEVIDSDGLRNRICEKCVKGWKGVTPRWLATMFPIDKEEVEDMEEEIEFSQENLTTIIEKAYGLDGWIFVNVRNGANFNRSQEHKDEQIKN